VIACRWGRRHDSVRALVRSVECGGQNFAENFPLPLDDLRSGIIFAASNLCFGCVNLRFIQEDYMATKIRPLHDRVIVKRIEEEEKTKGGIIIPDTAKEKPQEGRVVAVGPGKNEDGKVIPLGVKAGDKILFGKYSGTEIKLDGEEHLIMREDDILGVIE
jgi:chaperonin GroES